MTKKKTKETAENAVVNQENKEPKKKQEDILLEMIQRYRISHTKNGFFIHIENLWPRDGSCPPPLRSKRSINKCFRIVKVQKISRGILLMYVNHRLLRTKFLPLFVQRR